MKKILLAGIAAAAFCAAPAIAADMPHTAPVSKAAPAPVFSWNGCYGGIEGGGAWGKSKHTSDAGLTIADPKVDGGLFGGTLGCNYQSANWVFGVENDLSWAGLRGHH